MEIGIGVAKAMDVPIGLVESRVSNASKTFSSSSKSAGFAQGVFGMGFCSNDYAW